MLRCWSADRHRQLDPVNFERRFFGEITLEEALAQSINTASVRLLLNNGGPRPSPPPPHVWGSPTSCPTLPRWRWAPARSGCWN